MKTIGLIGGMSWESTVEYYRIINREVNRRLGGHHSAELLLYSVPFGEVQEHMNRGEGDKVSAMLVDAARRLETAGAGMVLICANTMHMFADHVMAAVDIPLVHIGDMTAEDIVAEGMKRVGLLGTLPTMEEDFYKGRMASRYGLDIMVPSEKDRLTIHQVIVNELCFGSFREESRKAFREIIQSLASEGAEGVILGCTEIPLLVTDVDSPVPLFNTTRIHALKAVDLALG